VIETIVSRELSKVERQKKFNFIELILFVKYRFLWVVHVLKVEDAFSGACDYEFLYSSCVIPTTIMTFNNKELILATQPYIQLYRDQ